MANIERIIESPYTALVIALVLGGLALSGKFSVTATQILLAVALVVVLIGLRAEPWPVMIGLSAIVGGVLLLLGYWFRPEIVALDLASNEGILVPSNDPMPVLPLPCNLPDNALAVFIGSNLAWSTQFPHTVVEMAGEPMLVIDKDARNTLKVTVLRIFDDRDDIIARIDDEGFWVQNNVRKKRPDPNTLVVYDHNDIEVLRIKFVNPRAIMVQGIFRHKKYKAKFMMVTSDNFIRMPSNNRITGNCFGETKGDINIDFFE